MRLLVFALVLGGCDCGSDGALLTIDLRTDMVPTVEFDGARIEGLVVGSDRVVLREEVLADSARDYIAGVRIAEQDGLENGTYVVRVQLTRGARVAIERTVRFEVNGNRGIVVVMTRSCRDVVCPGAGDDLAATSCLGGRCVDPRCIEPGDPACEGAADCSAASDCPAPPAACAEPVCLTGVCGHASTESACEAGMWCDPARGCSDLPDRPLDGGGRDAGVDAAVDGGLPDAGPLPDPGVIVAAGTSHACAVGLDSRAYCWGSNSYGQLGVAGSGTTAAQRVVPLPDVRAIAVDFGHTCAIATDGSVYCWGRNDAGQLGDGTTTDRAAPQLVADLPGAARAVALGASHTCVALDSGAIYCWGENSEGQLGSGTTTDRSRPMEIMGERSYASVSTGDFHSCGLKASGSVWCWGSNGRGQLGRGIAPASLPMSPTPGPVEGLTDARSISGDYRVTCARRESGAAVCWGEVISGQLGHGATEDSDAPVVVSGILDAVDVSAGAFHACAVLRGGEARCWGSNPFGQLGDETTTERTTPVRVLGYSDFVRISAGTGHFTCGVRASGEVRCWGRNESGQLGNGGGGDSFAPVRVAGLP